MTSTPKSLYAGYRFPGEGISHAVWLYFRFPLSLRMVEEMLAARGIDMSHETVRQWARKFGQSFANQIRRKLPDPGDKWHLDEVCLMIRGTKYWLWRAVDQDGFVLDVLVQSRRDKKAAKRRRRHKGLNNRAENSHQPTRRRERQMKRFKSPGQAQRFLSAHDQINNLFYLRRDHLPARQYRAARTQAFQTWAEVTGVAARA